MHIFSTPPRDAHDNRDQLRISDPGELPQSYRACCPRSRLASTMKIRIHHVSQGTSPSLRLFPLPRGLCRLLEISRKDSIKTELQLCIPAPAPSAPQRLRLPTPSPLPLLQNITWLQKIYRSLLASSAVLALRSKLSLPQERAA